MGVFRSEDKDEVGMEGNGVVVMSFVVPGVVVRCK
jgi:hypothetical protein